MLKKMLLIAAAVAIPMGATAVTAVVQSGTAGAVTPLAITCKVSSGTVTFAPPGISQNGSFESASTSTTTTTTVKYKCSPPTGSIGTTAPLNIVTANTQCTGTNTPVTGCSTGQYNYDSTSGFASNASTLWSDIKTLSIKIGTTTYKANLASSSVSITCASGEAGFNLKGKLTAPAAHAGETMKFTACLGSDTGPGTTGVFANDFGAPGVTIATAALAADSKAKIL
jgi:hypothetical protein